MTGTEVLVTVLVGVAIAVGVLGTILPILPGLFLVWTAMLVYGLVTGFGWSGWLAMILATLMLIAGLVLNVLIPQREAAGSGLSLRGQLAGLAVGVIGFFVIPVVGAPVGFVLGVFAVRLHATGDRSLAWTSTVRIVRSLIRAAAAQAAVAVAMGITWLAWVTVEML